MCIMLLQFIPMRQRLGARECRPFQTVLMLQVVEDPSELRLGVVGKPDSQTQT